ncbi:MAG: PepSY-associated TM helix domain-containing protein [Candidatus Delongbacteria bacterium]|nr:PepSY-associated TM helix domain-containing protein [Candidatus Delongbacteria bacterium]MBN2833941.1 PepSY-associated TM helix domain-containing protein [Candidatus Delongbacteria bacterium]
MKFNWRKWNLIIHRDLGFLFFGMTLIYAISGIAINHNKDWNPNYKVDSEVMDITLHKGEISDAYCNDLLVNIDSELQYKRFYFPNDSILRIIFNGGNLSINIESGDGVLTKTVVRPLLKQMNYLHYNPVRSWTWFSDIYAVSLILLAISGIIITRGKKGLVGRGGAYLLVGIIIPIIYVYIYH